jgi:hypothetical protein
MQNPSFEHLIELTSDEDYWKENVPFKIMLIPISYSNAHDLIGHGTKSAERRNIILMCRAFHLYELSLRSDLANLKTEFESKKLGSYIKVDHPEIKKLFGQEADILKEIKIWDNYQHKNDRSVVMPGIIDKEKVINGFVKFFELHKRVIEGEIPESRLYERAEQTEFLKRVEGILSAFHTFLEGTWEQGDLPSLLVEIRIRDPEEFWSLLDDYFHSKEWYEFLQYFDGWEIFDI